LAAFDDFLNFIAATRLTAAARRGDFNLFFGNFFVIFIMGVFGVGIEVFIGLVIL